MSVLLYICVGDVDQIPESERVERVTSGLSSYLWIGQQKSLLWISKVFSSGTLDLCKNGNKTL